MGQVLTPEQMPDAVIGTMNRLNKGKWIGEMTDLRRHVGFRAIAKEKREQLSAGRGITLRYVMDHNHSAKHVGLYNSVDFSKDDAIKEGTVPWVYTDGNMIFDEREPAMNNGPEEVVNLVKIEQARMMTSLVELSEEDVWGIPEDSNANDTPFGVQYWLTKSASLGFYGVDHPDFASGRAGISSTTYARHKNFTGAYSDVSDTESTGLIYQMEMAAEYCSWIAPEPEPGMGRSGFTTGIYTNWATKTKMKNVAKANNDSLGFDLATKNPVFRGAPIQVVPFFDDARYTPQDNPVYMIDHNHFYAMFLKNWWMKQTKLVRQIPNKPHCFGVIKSLVWNIVCDDLRKHAALYDATA